MLCTVDKPELSRLNSTTGLPQPVFQMLTNNSWVVRLVDSIPGSVGGSFCPIWWNPPLVEDKSWRYGHFDSSTTGSGSFSCFEATAVLRWKEFCDIKSSDWLAIRCASPLDGDPSTLKARSGVRPSSRLLLKRTSVTSWSCRSTLSFGTRTSATRRTPTMGGSTTGCSVLVSGCDSHIVTWCGKYTF